MKRATFVICLLVATLLAFGASAEDTASADKTLIGEYHWNQGYSGDLKAVFTPEGENQWKVSFYFDFRNEARVYTGTVTGSMDGELEGTVNNENKKRTFVFKGAFEDGVFQGDHNETTPGRDRRTGTLTLQ